VIFAANGLAILAIRRAAGDFVGPFTRREGSRQRFGSAIPRCCRVPLVTHTHEAHARQLKSPARIRALVSALFFLSAAAVSKASSPIPDDFYRTIYYPVRAVLDGGNPYDRPAYVSHYPVKYPFAPYAPAGLLVHLPFGLFSPAVQNWLYTGFMVMLAAVLVWLSMRYNGLRTNVDSVLLIAALLLLSRPGRLNLVVGSVTLQLVIATYVALWEAPRRPWLSGVALAIALLKASYGVPLALLMLGMGAGRAVLAGTGWALLINLPVLGLLAHRAGGFWELATMALAGLADFQTHTLNDPLYSPWRVDAVSLMSRLSGEEISRWGQLLVAATVIGTGIWVLRALMRTTAGNQFPLVVGIAGSVILLSVYHQPNDLLLLTLPLLTAVYHRFPGVLNRRGRRWTLLILYSFLAWNYLITYRMLERFGLAVPGPDSELAVVSRQPAVVLIFAANALAILAAYAMFLAACRPDPRRVLRLEPSTAP
jgi:Glycosyltransferase family 87